MNLVILIIGCIVGVSVGVATYNLALTLIGDHVIAILLDFLAAFVSTSIFLRVFMA